MAVGDGYKVGRMCKVYYDAAGAGAGTYMRLLIARDPKLPFEWDKAEVLDDASIFKRFLKGLLDVPLELTVNMKTGDTAYELFRDRMIDPDAKIGLAICTNLITVAGTHVFEADWLIGKFPIEMVQAETVAVPVELWLDANSSFAPVLREVAA